MTHAHLARSSSCPGNYRQILADAGFWPSEAAPSRRARRKPSNTCARHHGRAPCNAEFGKLAEAMSVRQCQDPAFIQLRDQLRTWFPEQS